MMQCLNKSFGFHQKTKNSDGIHRSCSKTHHSHHLRKWDCCEIQFKDEKCEKDKIACFQINCHLMQLVQPLLPTRPSSGCTVKMGLLVFPQGQLWKIKALTTACLDFSLRIPFICICRQPLDFLICQIAATCHDNGTSVLVGSNQICPCCCCHHCVLFCSSMMRVMQERVG